MQDFEFYHFVFWKTKTTVKQKISHISLSIPVEKSLSGQFAMGCCPSTALATLMLSLLIKQKAFSACPHFMHLSCWCFHTNKYSQISRNGKEVGLFSLRYINTTGSQSAILLLASLFHGFWKCWNTLERIRTTLGTKQQHPTNLKCLTLRTSWMLCI